MQPFSLLRALKRDSIDYVSGKYPFIENERSDLDHQLRELLEKTGTLFQDPVLQLGRSRKKQVFDSELFEPAIRSTVSTLAELREPYAHQVEAWNRISRNLPTVVSTGTGSGKSESFIIPVLDGLLKKPRNPNKKEIGAVFIYPMNALVQDQFLRMFKYAVGSGLRVGIYNGAFKELKAEERKKICNKLNSILIELKTARSELETGYDHLDEKILVVDPKDPRTFPDILLTNYKMLEYMLLRAQDQPVVDAFNLKYLVLDEAHTYTGTLALEISCLLARLRVHLGSERSQYLPIATSATLSGGGDSHETVEMELSRFFTKLFGKRFPESGFLVGEQYEYLPVADPTTLKEFIEIDPNQVSECLRLPESVALPAIAKLLCGIDSSPGAIHRDLYFSLTGREKHLSTIVLKNEDGQLDSTVTWSTAVERFVKRTGGTAAHLEALLTLFSMAYVNEKFPLLGLRVHSFARSEPKLLWSIDGSRVGDEETLAPGSGLSFVSCRQCQHMALGAIGRSAGGTSGFQDLMELNPLSDFSEELKDDPSIEHFVLHPPGTLNEEDLKGLSQAWKFEQYKVYSQDGKTFAELVSRARAPTLYPVFLRVKRESTGGNGASTSQDRESCPKCGSTSRDDGTVMVTHRGGASTDISIYAASSLTNISDDKERRLLIFADNRQETSFLAGFLTDRHRKVNLRRAISGYLEECKKSFQVADVPVTVDRKHDLAIRLIQSIEDGKVANPRESLPTTLRCKKSTLQNLIPRSVLDRPYWWKPRTGKLDEEVESIKQWLLENYKIGGTEDQSRELDEVIDLLDGSVRGNFILPLLTELILLDLSAGVLSDSHLATLDIARLEPAGFQDVAFVEVASKHPELGLDARGLSIMSRWLLDELLYAGVWSDLDQTGFTRYGFLSKFVAGLDPRFHHQKIESGLLGKSIEHPNGLSTMSRLAKILTDLEPDQVRDLLKIWSKKETWDKLIQSRPLRDYVFYSSEGRDAPRLKTFSDWRIYTDLYHYRGSLSHSEYEVTSRRVDLTGIPTGKRQGDVWQRVEPVANAYYLRLLKTPLSEQSRLVRAREHNGMLSAADANDALLRFEKSLVNTLVATPTLEMGVDLPDLPMVIHRSVPPGPSNYAQRAGRAGRGPKRAFVLTYCGLGSHDMTFFDEPMGMVSGEILPPGIPDRNPFIIKRHINGLVLEVMGLTRPEIGKSIELKHWHEFVPVSELRNRLTDLCKNSNKRPQFSHRDGLENWREIYSQRSAITQEFIQSFLEELNQGLWFDLKTESSRIDELKNELRRHASEFVKHFEAEISSYKNLVSAYLDNMEPFKNIPTPDDNAPYRQAKRFAELYLGAVTKNRFEIPWALSDLGATGFLPNFDFPGQVIRFKGLKDNNRRTAARADEDDRMLQYDRGGTVALREFAPEQKVYGHGFVYGVSHFLENDLVENTARGYGVCAEGCTTLAPPESACCPDCKGSVVRIEQKGAENGVLIPEIVQIREVHGAQVETIGDRSNFRERHYFAEEVRRVGAPEPDEKFVSLSDSEVEMSLHLSPEHYLKTVFLVLNRKGGKTSTAQQVFYRKRGNGTLFQVKLQLPENEPGWEPFIPSIQIEGQGIVFHLPMLSALRAGAISDGDPYLLGHYQQTLCALIKRASQKVLRLGSRGGNFDIQIFQIMESVGDQFLPKMSSFVLLDREPGGSGVIPLIWECWDEILARVGELILKKCCEKSCYRCLKSFDNQADHYRLDKSLFRVEGEAPIVEFLKKGKFKRVKNDHEKSVDEDSPAEASLKKVLLEEFSDWSMDTQVERRKSSGGLLTIPDFELTHDHSGEKVTVFVDGWKFHSSAYTFYGDLRKRNELVGRGYRVVTLPAALVLGDPQVEMIRQLLKRSQTLYRPFPVIEGLEMPEGTIPSHLEPEVYEQFRHLRSLGSDLQLIHFNQGMEKIKSLTNDSNRWMVECIEQIPRYLRPVGIAGDDRLVIRATAQNLLKDTEVWKNFWIYYSVLSAMGYRPLVMWCDPKPERD